MRIVYVDGEMEEKQQGNGGMFFLFVCSFSRRR